MDFQFLRSEMGPANQAMRHMEGARVAWLSYALRSETVILLPAVQLSFSQLTVVQRLSLGKMV